MGCCGHITLKSGTREKLTVDSQVAEKWNEQGYTKQHMLAAVI